MTENKYISGEGAIFQNKYKKMQGHPDKKGNMLIPKSLLKKMAEAFQNGETEKNREGVECIKMELATCTFPTFLDISQVGEVVSLQ
jgi:hypothetical protein